MAQQRSLVWPVITAVIGVLFLFLALPQSLRGWAPSFLATPDFHLGLDLAGGTQLDFRISEDELEQQAQTIDEHIRTLEAQGDTSGRAGELRLQRQVIDEQRNNLVEAIRTVL